MSMKKYRSGIKKNKKHVQEVNDRVDGRMKELLDFFDEAGLPRLVEISDPDGKPTYDKNGYKVKHYDMSKFNEVVNEVQRRASLDPTYSISSQLAVEKAAKEIANELRQGVFFK